MSKLRITALITHAAQAAHDNENNENENQMRTYFWPEATMYILYAYKSHNNNTYYIPHMHVFLVVA